MAKKSKLVKAIHMLDMAKHLEALNAEIGWLIGTIDMLVAERNTPVLCQKAIDNCKAKADTVRALMYPGDVNN